VGTFLEVFAEDDSVPLLEVSAALLACGDYSQRKSSNRFQFGTWKRKDVWRQLFTGTSSSDFSNTSGALMRMLDAIGAAADGPIRTQLQGIVSAFVAEQVGASRFDWRYYLVNYDDMRVSLLDHLRDIALTDQRQIFFATADSKIGALFGRKFRFLGERFKQIELSRE
jgi:hypothetical protein